MPLANVNVLEKGTGNGTVTNSAGFFLLNVTDAHSVLVVSHVGYQTREISVGSVRSFDIVLKPVVGEMDDVVIVGYGQQKKQSVVSAVSTVKGEALRMPTRSITNNLAGQVAGLIAIQRNGEPGYDNSEFYIRGISTFAGGKKPLVLVDGVPRAIADIEPDEIETFSILKDAAATAVYGAEGANGVVLITSKRGQNRAPVITFRTEHSINKPDRLPQFVGSTEYMELFNEALRNDGEAPLFSDSLINLYRTNADPDLYPNVDWIKTMLRDFTQNHRYTINARGGDRKEPDSSFQEHILGKTVYL